MSTLKDREEWRPDEPGLPQVLEDPPIGEGAWFFMLVAAVGVLAVVLQSWPTWIPAYQLLPSIGPFV